MFEYDKIDNLGVVLYDCWGKLDIFVGNVGILGLLFFLGYVDLSEWD